MGKDGVFVISKEVIDEILMRSDIETLKLALIDECESAEHNDMNSWKAALYRGLVSNFDKVKVYVFSLCINN